jgi:hypothetical protein
MKFKSDVLYGSLVLDELLQKELITKDHYDHMWEQFNEVADDVNYVLVDLSGILVNLERNVCDKIVDYLTEAENLKEFYTTKLAI